jgi:hypothetical protein
MESRAISKVDYRLEDRQCFADIDTTLTPPYTVQIGKYSKVLTEQKCTINLTPYLRELIKHNPFIRGNNIDNGNAVALGIKLDGVYHDTQYSYNGAIQGSNVILCSDLPYRVLAQGQTDVVTCNTVALGRMEVNGVDVEDASNDTDYAALLAVKLQPQVDLEVITYSDDGSEIYNGVIRYIYRPMGLNGVRLAWLNRYGAMEFWNFDHLREKTFATTTERIYTKDGYKKFGGEAETLYTVECREASTEVIDALAYIIASPAVWLVHDGKTSLTFEPIDVVTDECKTFEDDNILGLQVSYRKNKREKW